MAIKVYFDDNLLPENGLMSLSQSGELFDSAFKLGATLCRQVTLQVASKFLPTYDAPSKVKIYEDDDLKFTLYVDSMERVDEMSYSYTLVDSMVKLNVALSDVFEWDTSKSYTVQQIVNNICDYVGSAHVTIDYIGSLAISWDWDTQARDFLSYVGEINASYVRISPEGNIEFIEHKKATTRQLDIATCEDIAIGEYHCIQRVGYEQASASIYYPTTDVEYNTVYISQDNILITDSGDFTRENIIQHIYDKIVDFEFYSMTINRCQVDQNAIAGDNLSVGITQEGFLSSAQGKFLLTSLSQRIYIRLKEKKYIPTIVQINWDYNAKWNGGYELQIDSLQQEETQIVDSTEKKVNSLKITVDRELGVIQQEITKVDEKVDDVSTNLTENYSTTKQTAESIESAVSASETKIEGDVAETLKNYSTIEQTANSISFAVNASRTEIETEVAETYATTASLDAYVKEDEASGKVASWIEASADNIIIKYNNALIFGNYPDGQYMTVRTNDSNDGVLFEGTGTFTTNSVGDFALNNYSDSEYSTLKNKIHTNTYKEGDYYRQGMWLYNYQYGLSYVANHMYMIGQENYNYTGFVNRMLGSNVTANQLGMIAYSDNNNLDFINRKDDKYYANRLHLDHGTSFNQSYLSNFKFENTTIGNRILLNTNSSSDELNIVNYQLSNNVEANTLCFRAYSDFNETYLYNYELNSSKTLANYLWLRYSSSSNFIGLYNNYSNVRKGMIELLANSSKTSIVIDNRPLDSTSSIAANCITLKRENSENTVQLLNMCSKLTGQSSTYSANQINLSSKSSDENTLLLTNGDSGGNVINKFYMSTTNGTKILNQNSYLEFTMSQNTTLQSKYSLNLVSESYYVIIKTNSLSKKCVWKSITINNVNYWLLSGE